MNRIDYLIKYVMFEVFFWLWGAPLVILIFLLPPVASTVDRLLGACILLAFLFWYAFGSSWLAGVAARRGTYDYDSPRQAVSFALNEARLRLAFLPVVGTYLAPRTGAGDSTPPIEPK
jgi:hypothetical protein